MLQKWAANSTWSWTLKYTLVCGNEIVLILTPVAFGSTNMCLSHVLTLLRLPCTTLCNREELCMCYWIWNPYISGMSVVFIHNYISILAWWYWSSLIVQYSVCMCPLLQIVCSHITVGVHGYCHHTRRGPWRSEFRLRVCIHVETHPYRMSCFKLLSVIITWFSGVFGAIDDITETGGLSFLPDECLKTEARMYMISRLCYIPHILLFFLVNRCLMEDPFLNKNFFKHQQIYTMPFGKARDNY